MTCKPPLWADLLLTIWIAVVGLVYFGGYFWPDAIGAWTEPASRFYAVMLLAAAAVSTWRLLVRSGPRDSGKDGVAAGDDRECAAAAESGDARAVVSGGTQTPDGS